MKTLSFWNVFDDRPSANYIAYTYADGSAEAEIEQLLNAGMARHIAFSTDDKNPWWYDGEIILMYNMHVIFGKRAVRLDEDGYEVPFDRTLAILMPGVDSAALKPSDYHILIEALNWMTEVEEMGRG